MHERFRAAIVGLQAEQVGRPIVAATVTRQARSEPVEAPLVGYILPINSENMQHLHLFASGDMIITEAYLPKSGAKLREYQEQYGPGLVPTTLATPAGAVEEAIRAHITTMRLQGMAHNVRVLLSNESAEQANHFHHAMNAAIDTARLCRVQREQAKLESMSAFLDGVSQVVDVGARVDLRNLTQLDAVESPSFRSASGNTFELDQSGDLDLTTLYQRMALQHMVGELH